MNEAQTVGRIDAGNRIAAPIERETILMIQLCVEYLTLKGKRDDLRIALSTDESDRLDELARFFHPPRATEALPGFVRRDHRRLEVKVAVQFQRPDGSLGDGAALNLSGDGGFIATHHPLEPGARVILRASNPITDEASGPANDLEYRLAAEVIWSQRERGMGVRFVSIPLALRRGRPGHADRSNLHAA